MSAIFSTELSSWQPSLTREQHAELIQQLESGQVLFFPQLSFSLTESEKNLAFDTTIMDGKRKNIGSNGRDLSGSSLSGEKAQIIQDMMQRFASHARSLVEHTLPRYRNQLTIARTSFRPAEIEARVSSYRQDDRRLHVDAFPATPVHGKRILRVFTNINPYGEDRIWCIGENFKNVAQNFLPQAKKYSSWQAQLLHCLKLTKTKRSAYDHYMNQLHNLMKADDHYQQSVAQETVHFPPHSSWIAFTDKVSHAAMKGRYVLEQSFYLPIEAMRYPEETPLHILETALF